MKLVTATILSCLMFAPAALADVGQAPLAPGKPAGVRTAQFEGGSGMLVLAGAAAIGIGIALATASNNSNTQPTANTGSSVSTSGTTP